MNDTSASKTRIGKAIAKLNGAWGLIGCVALAVAGAVGWYEAFVTKQVDAKWEARIRKDTVDGEIKGLKVHVGEVDKKVVGVGAKLDQHIEDQATQDADAKARAERTGKLVEKLAKKQRIKVDD